MKKSIIALFIALGILLFPACGGLDDAGSSSPVGDSSSSGYEGPHADDDADGVCDNCKEDVTVTFDVFAVNDLHGKFSDTTTQPGVDEMTAYIKRTRAENPNTIVLSSGDMWQGSPESNLTKGNVVTEWMNDVGFAAMTLGNHEYDWGEEYIAQNAELAEFPLLGINVFDPLTNVRKAYCQPSVMVELGEVQVGIIGAEGNVLSSISADKTENVEFRTGNALTNLVKAEATRLRSEGADLIIYSIHDGQTNKYDHYDETLSKGYVDVVFEAHTHSAYKQADKNGVWHIQAGGDNSKGLAHAKIKVNYVASKAQVTSVDVVEHATYATLTPDPIVETLQTKYAAEIAPMHEVLGNNERERSSADIVTALARRYYEAGQAKWGSQYQIVLGGGYLSTRAPNKIAAGPVTYGDLMNVLPFDNQIVLCKITGGKLKQRFIDGDYVNYFSSYGNSVKNNIDRNAIYYVVVDKYTSNYRDNGLTEVATYDQTTFPRDLYAQFIRDGGLAGSTGGNTNGDTEALPAAESKTLADILTIGNGLADGASTTEIYRTWGKIVDINNTTFGNMTIDDGKNQLYVYGTYDQAGNRYDKMADKPQENDIVCLQSVVKKYKGTIELFNAVVVAKLSDIPTALSVANGLAANAETTEKYAVKGTVVSVEARGTLTIQDEEGRALYVYRPWDETGKEYATSPAVGDVVIYEGTLKKYVSGEKTTLELFHPQILWTAKGDGQGEGN